MTKKIVAVAVVLFALAMPAIASAALKIGLAAMISPKETVKFYGQMLDYVGKKLGQPVEMVQKENYDEMDAMLEKGEVSIAFICSGPYVKDKTKFNAELLVAPQSYGKPVYYAYILVPTDSPFKSWDDLKGKKFAFTDPKSNTGKLVPTFMIAKQFNQTPEQFFGADNITFTRSHDKSIEAVAKKLVDGSSVDSLIYDYTAKKYPEKTQGTRILIKSPPYGIPPVVINPKFVDQAVAEKVKNIFLKMHEDAEGKAILDGIMVDKFVIPKDEDYNTVREMNDFVSKMK